MALWIDFDVDNEDQGDVIYHLHPSELIKRIEELEALVEELYLEKSLVIKQRDNAIERIRELEI